MGLGAGAGGPSFALLIRVDFSQAASLARSSSCACVVAEGLFAASDEKQKYWMAPLSHCRYRNWDFHYEIIPLGNIVTN